MSKTEARKSALLLAGVMLAGYLVFGSRLWLIMAAVFCLLAFSFPRILSPFYYLLIRLGRVISKVTNPLVLGLIYFFVLTPIAFLSRFFQGDTMRMRQFRTGKDSVFRSKASAFTYQDLRKPF